MTEKRHRKYIPDDLRVTSWATLEPFFDRLDTWPFTSLKAVDEWLAFRSEIECFLEEDLAWRYIRMNCDTANESLSQAFNFYITEIEPNTSERCNQLDKKLIDYQSLSKLENSDYALFIRQVKSRVKIFRKENVPIIAQLQKEEQEYGRITSQMTVDHEGIELTLQQAANLLKVPEREIRQQIFEKINKRRFYDRENLDQLFSDLIEKRHKIAANSGFDTYVQYKFADLNRFDYNQQDCFRFHESIAHHVVPLVDELHTRRCQLMKLDSLRPFDLEVDPEGKPPIVPFKDADELVKKTITCFTEINSKFGGFLQLMNKKGHFDLDSRIGKAPGGFNYPLYESNIPFIFMNATGNLRDLETMIHECGHAVHSFLTNHFKLVFFRELPAEVAELASMAMELIASEHYSLFFENMEDLKRARRHVLENTIEVLPWVATVDKFQHWIYTHPRHSFEERKMAWNGIFHDFAGNSVDWKGYEQFFSNQWQRQLHIFEVPFYYIEYGMAQLGALAIWKNYKKNPKETLLCFENALQLGYSKPIPEIYKTAGIEFNFSPAYIKELMDFVKAELLKLE